MNDVMGERVFWIIAGVFITSIVSLLIYYIQTQSKRRDRMEQKLVDALDQLKVVVNELKNSMTGITTGCVERHKALNAMIANMTDDIKDIQTDIKK